MSLHVPTSGATSNDCEPPQILAGTCCVSMRTRHVMRPVLVFDENTWLTDMSSRHVSCCGEPSGTPELCWHASHAVRGTHTALSLHSPAPDVAKPWPSVHSGPPSTQIDSPFGVSGTCFAHVISSGEVGP